MHRYMQNDVHLESAKKIAQAGVKYYVEVANMPTTNDALMYFVAWAATCFL